MNCFSIVLLERVRSLSASLLFVCWAFASVRLAQQPLKTLLVGVDHRAVTSLNGDWHYLVDQPPAKGLYTSSGKVRDNGYALNTHPNIKDGPHNEEYDFATAPL
jgi:beta-glucuronidase